MRRAPLYWSKSKKIISKRDPIIRKLLKKYKRGFLKTKNDPFFSLARTIVGQQISKSLPTVSQKVNSMNSSKRARRVTVYVGQIASTRIVTFKFDAVAMQVADTCMMM